MTRWAFEHARAARPVVLTDWPQEPRPEGLAVVDWAWWQAAYAIGAAAAVEGFARFAVVAGPSVATQRRLVGAARSGYLDLGGRGDHVAFHLDSFADHSGARLAAEELLTGDPGLLLTSAGAASGELAALVREGGWQVAGFGSRDGDWRYSVSSDVAGGVRRILTDLLAGEEPPEKLTFGASSGLLKVRSAADVPSEAGIALDLALLRAGEEGTAARLTAV